MKLIKYSTNISMNNLKILRQRNKLTQKQLGKVLNIEQSTYSKLESGKTRLKEEDAETLSEFYKIPLSYIFENQDDKIEISKEDFEILLKARDSINKIEKLYITKK